MHGIADIGRGRLAINAHTASNPGCSRSFRVSFCDPFLTFNRQFERVGVGPLTRSGAYWALRPCRKVNYILWQITAAISFFPIP